ncbi:asparagine synthase-related protein [Streptomyces sp. NPDC001455]|uniref:asparagine synthase-related protein n=1 Tax=unclassified Streptomyces TaxID=2593676 RepID=UPI00332DCEBA
MGRRLRQPIQRHVRLRPLGHQDEELLLVRDRLGIKPLYSYPTASGVLCGSEPKAVLANPLGGAVPDLDRLRNALALVRVPGRTPLKYLFEVRPGHIVHAGPLRRPRQDVLWPSPPARTPTTSTPPCGRSWRTRSAGMISDVPLCTLLSGGLDSSAPAALAQRSPGADGGGRVRTFSVDFAGPAENFE